MSLPAILAAAGGGLVLVILLVLLARRRSKEAAPDPRLLRDLRTGNYEQAAQRALNAGDLAGAFDLFLRAQKVLKAAHIAEQLGRLPDAAQLFEHGGDLDRAAALWRKLGQPMRADELAAKASGRAPRPPTGPAPSFTVPLAAPVHLDFAAPPPNAESPLERARREEAALEPLLRRAAAGEPEARLCVPDAARRAVDAWMDAGDLRRAAEVALAAGLVEQAVNLHANLLGEPARAAEILLRHGEARRAAELFEVAGEPARALDAWLQCAASPDPVEHVFAVARLGTDALERYADAVLRALPATGERGDATPDPRASICGRLASALFAHGAGEAGRRVLERATALGLVDPSLRARALAGADDAARTLGPTGTKLERPRAPAKLTLPAHLALRPEDLERIANEAAGHLATHLRASPRGPAAPPKPIVSRGFETADLRLDFARDPAVQEARAGMSTRELEVLIGGRDCDLINIEVYYRLGLAHLAAGRWEDAKRNFAIVEATSRGYRDARRRAEAIAAWKAAVGETHALRSQLASHGDAPAESRYTLLGELGRGGMAVVYRARDEALRREVALKFIAEGYAGDERMRALFEREAHAAASLNHPNIVTVYDFGETEGRPFIAMELVVGTTVDEAIEREGRLPILDALRIAEQVLSALHYAHERRILHRDVKPANMMRSQRGLVKLMDFGLAKSADARRSTIISGTPAYMAPEQMSGGELGGGTDVFALGASLYQMLTGHFAFEGLRREPPPLLSSILPAAPKLLEWAVHRALELDPRARFETAGEMAEVLREILRAATEHAQHRPPISLARL